MTPICANTFESEECFDTGNGGNAIGIVMETSTCSSTKYWLNPECIVLNHVFAFRKDGRAKASKVENSTDTPDEIKWQHIAVEVDLGVSGQVGKNFHALCQDALPTTTTTTTTTTATASPILSRKEMEEHLRHTACPLSLKAGDQSGPGSETEGGLPIIDLFLNPERNRELEELRLWVKKNEENLTYTEVNKHVFKVLSNIYPFSIIQYWPRMRSPESTPTSLSCCGTPCFPASHPMTTQTHPICSTGAHG